MKVHNFTLHLTLIPRLLTKIYEVLRLSSKGAYATAVRSTYTLILGQRCELGFLTNGPVCAPVLSSIAFFQSEWRDTQVPSTSTDRCSFLSGKRSTRTMNVAYLWSHNKRKEKEKRRLNFTDGTVVWHFVVYLAPKRCLDV
ncbi:unnamed protein product [Ixodes pacificus]